jgi:hypothetical protein
MRSSLTCAAAMLAALLLATTGLTAAAEVRIMQGEQYPYSHSTFAVDAGTNQNLRVDIFVTSPGWYVVIQSGKGLEYGTYGDTVYEAYEQEDWETAYPDGSQIVDPGTGLQAYALPIDLKGGGVFYISIYAKENPGGWIVQWDSNEGATSSGLGPPGVKYDGRSKPYCEGTPPILGPGVYRMIVGVDRACNNKPVCFGINRGRLFEVELNGLTPGTPCEGKGQEGEGI